ncbi:MAG: GntR family transcriptional regulator, partial [Burkholderiales bacterium]
PDMRRSPVLQREHAHPLYRQLAEHIQAQVAAGKLVAGQRLPSEPELMEAYGVSRITVRQAIALLVRSGQLVTQRGKGTFVTAPVVRHELDALRSFQDALRHQGIEPRTQLVEWSATHGAVDAVLPPGLQLPVRLRRLYFVEQQPFAVVTAWLPARAGDIGRARAERLNVYEILHQFLGVHVSRADVTIRCERAPADIAHLLTLPRRSPVLLMERSSFDARGRVCEHMRIHIVPERYEFRISLPGEVNLARAVHPAAASRVIAKE